MPLDTKENIVLEGIDRYAKAELKIRQARKEIEDIIEVIKAANMAGMMGAIRAFRMEAELRAAAGDAARAEAALWRSHEESYTIEKENDIQISGPLSGGPR